MNYDSEKLYEEYHDKVFRYIYSKVNDFYLSEDLCSDVFVKVVEKLDTFNEKKASISTWIFTIARNRLIDYYRTRKVTSEIPDDLTYEEEDEGVDEEQLETLAEALENIDERSRKLIILHYYSEMTLKEVAVKLGISYPYAKILHKKALEKLKKFFN